MKSIYLIMFVLLSTSALAYTVDVDAGETFSRVTVRANDTELPINDNVTFLFDDFNAAQNYTLSISYGDYTSGATDINLTNTSNYTLNVFYELPILNPNLYTDYIEIKKDNVSYYYVVFDFFILEDFGDVFDNVTVDYIDLDNNFKKLLLYDVQLPFEDKQNIIIKSTANRTVNVSCTGYIICTANHTPETSISTYNITIRIPRNVELINTTSEVTFTQGAKSATYTYIIDLRVAPVNIREIYETRYEDLNFSNLTDDEFIIFLKQFDEHIADRISRLEASRRTIKEEVPVEVEKFIPVSQIRERDRYVEELITRLETEELQLRTEQIRLSQIQSNFTDQQAILLQLEESRRQREAQIRAEERQKIEDENKLPAWLVVLIWIGCVGICATGLWLVVEKKVFKWT